jgi:large conductance mechanosensitive channel
VSGFKKFLLRGNVVDLAIAVVIGAAFGAVVTALVKDIITPILGIFGGLPDFSAWSFTINGSKFLIGDFINVMIAFVALALVIYFLVVQPVEKMMERNKPAPVVAPDTDRDCPYCLSKIPKAASRCAFCTSEVTPVAKAPTAAAPRA